MHRVTNPDVHEGLAQLVAILPLRLHLVMIGRSEPACARERFALQEQLGRIGIADLRFQHDEIAAFMVGRSIPATATLLAELETHTEGWPAALAVIALAMKEEGGRADAASILRSSEHGFERYLLEEVLAFWPQEKRSFVQACAILDLMEPAACTAITGCSDSGHRLAAMVEQNEFTQAVGLNAFRFHPIFRDVLTAQLEACSRAYKLGLHARAAAWYEENGRFLEAVPHWLSACRFREAASLIDRQLGELPVLNAVDTGLGWIRSLPGPWRDASPRMAAFEAYACIDRNRFEDAQAWLETAQSRMPPKPENPAGEEGKAWKRINDITNLLWAFLHLRQGRLDLLVERFRTDPPLTGTSDRVSRFIDFNRSDIYFLRCPIHPLVRLAETRPAVAARFVSNYNRITTLNPGYMQLAQGEGLYEADRLTEALPLLTEAMEMACSAECPGVLVPAMVDIARIRRADGDMQGAFEALDACERLLVPINRVHWLYLLRACRAGFHLGTGNMEMACRWSANERLDPYSPIHDVSEFELLVHARSLLAHRRLADAEVLLERLAAHAERQLRPHSGVEAANLLALLARARGDNGQMVKWLTRSLSIGLAQGYVRSYLDEGVPMADMLRRGIRTLSQREDTRPLSAYAEQLLARMPSATQHDRLQTGVSEAVRIRSLLTPKEQKVLELVYAAEPNEMTCARLNIGLRTVKTHTGNIYAKLGVENRVQCLRLIREIGYFD